MPATLSTLQQLIQAQVYNLVTQDVPNLFHNEKGANSSADMDGLYIDCQPVGASEETTDKVMFESTSGITWSTYWNNASVQLVVIVSVCLLLLFGLRFGLGYIVPASFQETFQSIFKHRRRGT